MATERKDQVAAMGIFDGRFDNSVTPVVIPTVIAADGFGTIVRNSVGNYSISLNVPPIAPRQGVPQALPMGGALNKLSCVSEGASLRVLSTDAFGAPADCALFSVTLERTSSPGSSLALPVVPALAGGGFAQGHWFASVSPVADGSAQPVILDTEVLNTAPTNFVFDPIAGTVEVTEAGIYVLHQCAGWVTAALGVGIFRTNTVGDTHIEQSSETTANDQLTSVGASLPVELASGAVVSQTLTLPTNAGNLLTIAASISYLAIHRVGPAS